VKDATDVRVKVCRLVEQPLVELDDANPPRRLGESACVVGDPWNAFGGG
jgi:hypothetical protein